MARIRKEEDHALKRSEIIDAARRLVFTKGYEQMSIQDLLDQLNVSKGAFYHYFPSKQAVLEALIDQIIEEGIRLLNPTLQDPGLNAQQKLERYYQNGLAWKSQQKDMMIGLLRIWYADENALLRQKILARSLQAISPMITEVVCEGKEQGIFHISHPEQVAGMIVILQQTLADVLSDALLNPPEGKDAMEQSWLKIKQACEGYTETLERVLGATPGTMRLIDLDMLKEWLVK